MSLAPGNRTLLSSLQNLSEAASYHQLVSRLTGAMEQLIPSEGAVVFELRNCDNQFVSVTGNARLSQYFEERLDLLSEMQPLHPVAISSDLENAHAHEFVVSDIISPKAFRAHHYYRKVLAGLGTEECIFGQLFHGSHRTIWASCFRKKDTIKPREREIFRQLLAAVHSAALIHNTDIFEKTLLEGLCRLEPNPKSHPGLIFLGLEDESPLLDFTSSQYLNDVFGNVDRESVFRTLRKTFRITCREGWIDPFQPRWVQAPVQRSQGKLSAECLAKRDGSGAMLISPTDASSGRGAPEKETISNCEVLTNRQNAVLFWVSEGKSNEEISLILGISRRTVEKHLQLAFQALGVENRLAATMEYLRLKKN
jgi:DNA-binding CsgD family transcriptional regulator